MFLGTLSQFFTSDTSLRCIFGENGIYYSKGIEVLLND